MTAVGEVKALFLHGAREWLADFRSAPAVAGRAKQLADTIAAARVAVEAAGLVNGPEEAGCDAPLDPSAAQLRQRRAVSRAPP